MTWNAIITGLTLAVTLFFAVQGDVAGFGVGLSVTTGLWLTRNWDMGEGDPS